ncbi:MAG: hypothetical protein A2268_06500 [Candidatus Raymondbacteria bacterium RifOxyA12_full_50_37]|uniref:DUF362 domain-containing protein n=1 Tax=Candidatus Raymondbacteria bacterium RIFOXYD12_FULL_49_13 TaxID=1817890 RepID=A0A1F7EZH1_UNCRA|nr:MAG: hypothetical protein A2268_06500 [Candidatus Raymondbacteria bacterium RifOxyA12_full_50_37]OGJ92675.1 MAG: hypothetical protein A2350_03925 [Candidatus Raymondbacteria bacterium RifOxyB12_full_50_8]OGJ94477.1 MAG: hypothetical protein A2248_15430 [Candidatus Raymondbacteria bacterium RIFOXYA2_FULL_49_16]OGJ99230.1 MAG: hypothetical protein A2453_07280 [Candidatus Raymondbacteria bacterium RIFOXYC2_FULL_50_21]OGJ99784.1 MAG: hypothetical protein A2519_12580 [Candidatus Raymondbacteria b
MSRRRFLGAGAAAVSSTVVAPSLLSAQTAKPVVAVAKGAAADAVRKAVDALGGMGAFVQKGARVVIKPNMGFPNPPEWATTTNPEVVKIVVDLCIEAGARRVIVMDHPLRDAEICKARTGIADMLKDVKQAIVAFPDDPKFYDEVSVPGAQELKKTAVAKEVLKADVLICVPVAKSHSATGVSLSIKGLMGLVWNRQVFHEQMELNRAIAEQLYVIKPKLTIIDAMNALITNGPSGPGKVEKLGTIVASADPVAADSYTVGLARWYNREFKGSQVKHLKIANELGFGEIDIEKMDVRII